MIKFLIPTQKKIGLEVDYYKVRDLNKNDIEIIYKLSIEHFNSQQKKISEKWIELYNKVYVLKNFVEFNNIKNSEIDDALDILIHNLDEELHSSIERIGAPYINKILNYDLSSFDKDQDFSDFIYYLSTQYFRTSNRKTKLEAVLKDNKNIKVDKIWNILTHIFSTNMAAQIYAKRPSFNICLLKNNSKIEYITGDQPVINTYASGLKSTDIPEKLEFYYPISPEIAIPLLKEFKKLIPILFDDIEI